MAKYHKAKKTDECPYVLYPVGPGMPLCAYKKVKLKELAGAKLQDFPVCRVSEGKCYKMEEIK